MAFQRGVLYLTTLTLPFSDFGIEGDLDRFLSIPTDAQLSLAYPVVNTAIGPKWETAMSDGTQMVAGNHAPLNKVDIRSGILGATSSLLVVPNFTPTVFWFTAQSNTLSLDVNVPGSAVPLRLWSASGTNQFVSIGLTSVTLNNPAASALTYWVSFFA